MWEDLDLDRNNDNLGTLRGEYLLETSLRNLGGGRGIAADRNGVVIAGNHTAEKARELGFKPKYVHTTGDQLVAGRRRDLKLSEGGKARTLSYVDNRANEVGLRWDKSSLLADRDLLGPLFTTAELTAMAKKLQRELSGEPMGEGTPRLFSRFTLRVSPQTQDELARLMREQPGGTDDERFCSLVGRLV